MKRSRKIRIYLIIAVLAVLVAILVGLYRFRVEDKLIKIKSSSKLACTPLTSWESGDFINSKTLAIFNNNQVNKPDKPLAYVRRTDILGETTEEKWIDIDLSEQKIRAMQGTSIVMEFPISSGKWAPTPKGEFNIWIKLRYSTMSGGDKSQGTYYYLPNVPYVMFFYGPYGIHGAYWHNNFGTPMSHGCVNMSVPDSQSLFDWALPKLTDGESIVRATAQNPGSRVVVHD